MAERRVIRDNSLTLVFIALFAVTLLGQGLAGWQAFNADQQAHHESSYSLARYLVSSDFGGNMLENWQSEFLQFASFIALGAWLRQRGSTESKELDQSAMESDKEQKLGKYAEPASPWMARAGGWRTAAYSHSLLMLMLVLWLGSWGAGSLASWTDYNQQQQEHQEASVGYGEYLSTADFWDRTLQNWQSEFLAVASISIFSVFLRERGSPQSKPVGAPHEKTGVSS